MLSEELATLDADLDTLTTRANPSLSPAHGIGPITAAQLLVTAGGNPERLTHKVSVRCPDRCQPNPGILGENQPLPAQPWR
jgi:hypothetical protein